MRRMVFDVESVGLHGEGFAVGFVILEDEATVDEAWGWCSPGKAAGTAKGRGWVEEHCLWAKSGLGLEDGDLYRLPPGRTFKVPYDLREWFWGRWLDFKGSHPTVELWADVAWPVEARFLIACVEDSREAARPTRERGRNMKLEQTPREWEGPFPLLDVEAVARAALGNKHFQPDPGWKAGDLPFGLLHHPLSDARSSAGKLLWAERKLQQ